MLFQGLEGQQIFKLMLMLDHLAWPEKSLTQLGSSNKAFTTSMEIGINTIL